MKNQTFLLCALLAFSVLFASCSSTTIIQSNPSKAKLYINGEFVGETPYMHTDSKIVGSSLIVKLEKEGFKPFVTTITKDEEPNVGAIVGGLFFGVPFLWTMNYQAAHNYELNPADSKNQEMLEPQKDQNSQVSKAEKLREMKKLLDDKIITADEFEKEKAKILDNVE